MRNRFTSPAAKSARPARQTQLLLGAALTLLINSQMLQADDAPSGAFSRISPDNVLNARALVTEGKVYSLALPSAPETPAFGDRSYRAVVEKIPNTPFGKNQFTGLDDRVETHTGVGTQIDGLGHVGINHVHYGGVHEDELFSADGLKVFGIQDVPPAVTRGVLLDMAAFFGVDMLDAGTAYNREQIEGALERQNLELQAGDVVLFHSGWLALYGEDNERWLSEQPGLGKEGAEYLAELGVVAVGADTAALEAIPYEDPEQPLIVHQTLLVKNGIYILEYVDTRELAADEVYEFMFVLAAPRLSGAVQAQVHPVAIR